MMKNAVFLLTLSIAVLTGCQLFVTSEKTPSKKIAILFPIAHPSLEKIKNAFKEQVTATSKEPVSFIEYNGSGNRILMHQQTEQALAQNPDLIFAIATSSAALLTAAALKQQSTTPIVCGAADVDVISVQGKLPPHVACVTDIENYPEQLRLLKVLRPTLKKLLIVHDQSCAKYHRDLDAHIRPAAAKLGIELSILPVSSAQELHAKVPHRIAGVDALMVFKDSVVVSGLETLVKICSDNGITLYTSDLDSVARGAAAGYGLEEAETGRIGGELAGRLLQNPAMHIDPVFLYPDALLINRATMQSQGLDIAKEQLQDTSRGTLFIEKGK